jgi:hypothetical protein
MVAMVALLLSCLSAFAKGPIQTLNWPSDEKPILRFEVDNITRVGSVGKQNSYEIDITVQNLWNKAIPSAEFYVYMYDKNKVRIGDGWIDFTNVGPQQAVKVPLHAAVIGSPQTISVAPRTLPAELGPAAPAKLISINIYSVPSGATLKVDGKEFGTTPVAARLTVGSHTLTFDKEGYTTGTFPLAVSGDQLSGGTVTYELGRSGHDTIELRDGSVLSGDVESMDGTQVVIEIGGKPQTFDRNQVKRISLVPRSSQ